MNETKIIVYVPFHPELGYEWGRLTTNFQETKFIAFLSPEWKWYQIIVDGDKKELVK